MTEENKRRNIAQETARGSRALEEARLLLEAGLYEGSVSRAYAAAFHYARAVLLSESIEARTHAGVRNQLSLHFVITGRLDAEVAGLLTQLQAWREQSDYDTAVVFTQPMAEEASDRALRFLTPCRQLLSDGGYL